MRNYNLDILKFFSSFFIVYLHTEYAGAFEPYITATARFAVPVFFLCSGYFSYTVITKGNVDKIKARIKKLLCYYLIAEVLYTAKNIMYLVVREHKGVSAIFDSVYNKAHFIRLVLLQQAFNSAHLWFLLALIVVYLISIALIKTKKQCLMPYFSALILVPLCVVRFLPAFDGEIITDICVVRNAFLTGLPIFSIGYSLRMYYEKIAKIKPQYLLLAIAAGFALTIFERYLLPASGRITCEYYIGSIVLAVSAFVLCLNTKSIKSEFLNNKIFPRLGNISTYIYIFHVLMITVAKAAMSALGLQNQVIMVALSCIAALIFAVALDFAVEWISSKRKA